MNEHIQNRVTITRGNIVSNVHILHNTQTQYTATDYCWTLLHTCWMMLRVIFKDCAWLSSLLSFCAESIINNIKQMLKSINFVQHYNARCSSLFRSKFCFVVFFILIIYYSTRIQTKITDLYMKTPHKRRGIKASKDRVLNGPTCDLL